MHEQKQKEEVKIKDWLNFLLGQYIAFAINDPKKYPKKPFLAKEEKQKGVMTPEEMEKIAMRNTIILGGKINNGKRD